jgi:VanZ family protein
MMILIFLASNTPADQIPYFGDFDIWVKKGGHVVGYSFLSLAYYYAMPSRLSRGYRLLMAWMMALLFALSDEYHQSFVEGRTSSVNDVVIDGFGAGVALILGARHSSNSSSSS